MGFEELKLETTAEERAHFTSHFQNDTDRDREITPRANFVLRLLRDFDRILADNARLKAEKNQREDYWRILCENREVEVARLKAELAEVESAASSVRLCQCELTREIEVLVDGKGCELHEESDGAPLTSTQVAAALKFYQERVQLVKNEATAREVSARSSELRYLSTFTPILDKRVQTEGQLFGWMAACEAWRAAIAARRTT